MIRQPIEEPRLPSSPFAFARVDHLGRVLGEDYPATCGPPKQGQIRQNALTVRLTHALPALAACT